MYDIFYVSKTTGNDTDWAAVKSKYSTAQRLSNIESFDQIKSRAFTKMFWVIWDDIILNDSFDLLEYAATKWDDQYVHVFKNGEHYDGVVLFSKNIIISKKEFDYRFFMNKKELDIIASNPKPYDVVFISYNESNADINYENLKLKRPDAKRVHGVKGIHNAHIEAAKLATTEMFWVVDADAELVDNFNFEITYFPHYDVGNRSTQISTVHVWLGQNPINDLVYGYGGVKLLPRTLTINMDTMSSDMTTSISKNFKAIDQVSNITVFDTDPFNTWKSAFRECVKLSSRAIDRQNEEETSRRLDIWCSLGDDKLFGKDAIRGAKEGRLYGETHKGNIEALIKINDFDWLKGMFDNGK